HDVINAVLEGSQNSTGAPLSSSGGSTPPQVISHQKQPGGAAQPVPVQSPTAGGDILGSILSSVLGSKGQAGGVLGGQSMPAGGGTPGASGTAGIPWGDIIGTMMGAGLGSVAANTVLAPIINQIAQRFNIPPLIAQIVV